MIDWHIYNESLVRRGEVVLDFDVIDNWNNKLALRKLRLQVQMSVDGGIAGPNGEMDWMVWTLG